MTEDMDRYCAYLAAVADALAERNAARLEAELEALAAMQVDPEEALAQGLKDYAAGRVITDRLAKRA